MRKREGFTLVEILVALAIVAIALTAGMRALTQATDSAAALKARTLGLWVAQNRLAAAQIATPWPALGSYSGDAQEAGATRQRTGRADADGSALAQVVLGGGDELRDRVERGAVIALRGRHAAPRELAADLVERDDLHFRAAEIDA